MVVPREPPFVPPGFLQKEFKPHKLLQPAALDRENEIDFLQKNPDVSYVVMNGEAIEKLFKYWSPLATQGPLCR
jgi:hypothetical protein